MARQRHDLGHRKWVASEPARRAAERRRAQVKRLVRRKKLRAARARTVDPESINSWREAKKRT
jgi:hypothetical protein